MMLIAQRAASGIWSEYVAPQHLRQERIRIQRMRATSLSSCSGLNDGAGVPCVKLRTGATAKTTRNCKDENWFSSLPYDPPKSSQTL